MQAGRQNEYRLTLLHKYLRNLPCTQLHLTPPRGHTWPPGNRWGGGRWTRGKGWFRRGRTGPTRAPLRPETALETCSCCGVANDRVTHQSHLDRYRATEVRRPAWGDTRAARASCARKAFVQASATYTRGTGTCRHKETNRRLATAQQSLLLAAYVPTH